MNNCEKFLKTRLPGDARGQAPAVFSIIVMYLSMIRFSRAIARHFTAVLFIIQRTIPRPSQTRFLAEMTLLTETQAREMAVFSTALPVQRSIFTILTLKTTKPVEMAAQS